MTYIRYLIKIRAYFIPAFRHIFPFILLLLFFNNIVLSQTKLDEISRLLKISNGYIGLRLSDGKEISGYAELNEGKQIITIKQKNGETIEIPVDKINVKYITTYEQVLQAPVTPPRIYVDLLPGGCCRDFPFYFAEIHAAFMKAKDVYFGAEAALGLNEDLWSFGIGAGVISIHSVTQTPVYFHVKRYFSRKCINPFLYADLGYPFNNITSKYTISFPDECPVTAGIGAGFDYSINCFMDLSLTLGYKYMKLAVEKEAPSCNKVYALAFDEFHSVYVTLGITF
jgi:hypothetical protein